MSFSWLNWQLNQVLLSLTATQTNATSVSCSHEFSLSIIHSVTKNTASNKKFQKSENKRKIEIMLCAAQAEIKFTFKQRSKRTEVERSHRTVESCAIYFPPHIFALFTTQTRVKRVNFAAEQMTAKFLQSNFSLNSRERERKMFVFCTLWL